MQHLQNLTQYLQLDQHLDNVPQLKFITQKTTLKPSVLCIIVGMVMWLISLFLIDLSGLINAVVRVVVPIYLTVRVIEGDGNGEKSSRVYLVKYLMYWMVFGAMEIIVEPILCFVMPSNTVMSFLHLILVVALLHPKIELALMIHHWVFEGKKGGLSEDDGLTPVAETEGTDSKGKETQN